MADAPDTATVSGLWNWLFLTCTGALGICIMAIYRIFSSGQERIHMRIDKNSSTIAEHASKLAVLEEAVTHLATAKDIGQIYQRVNDVASEVSNIKGQQETIIKLLSKRVDFS